MAALPTTRKFAQPTAIRWHSASTDGVGLALRAQWNRGESAFDKNRAFMALLAAYRASGGLARSQEIIGWLRRHNRCNVDALSRWVHCREVVSLDWQDETWLPWFQFDHAAGQRSPCVAEIVKELRCGIDDWSIACWFAYPHARLGDHSPAEALPCRAAEVLAAARGSPFTAAA